MRNALMIPIFVILFLLVSMFVSADVHITENDGSGAVSIRGSNVYYNATPEMEINPSRFRLPGVNPPQEQIIGLAPVLSFDKATNESAYTTKHVIPEYKNESIWYIAIYWSPDDAGAGSVVWCIEVIATTAENSEFINETGAQFCVTDATNNKQYELLKTSNIAMSGTGVFNDDEVAFRIFRAADESSDNYDDDAHLIEATIYYESYRLGE